MSVSTGRVEVIDRGESPSIIDLDYHNDRPIPISNKGQSDAFGRIKSAEPYTLFDSKFLFDKRPLFWDEVISGAGAGSAFSNSSIVMSVTSNGEYVIRQTFQKMNYQPGKSQEIFLTGIISQQAGVTKRAGYFSSSTTAPYTANLDGLWFEVSASEINCCIGKSGSITSIAQSNWNLDKLDGTGLSGIELDMTKDQIFFIQFEWLGVGSVWFGFLIGGELIYVHRQDFSNESADGVYMLSPNQPVRYEIRSTGGSGSLVQICSSVNSGGGKVDNGILRSRNCGTAKLDADVVGTCYASVGLRLKSGYRYGVIKPEVVSVSSVVATPGDKTLVELRLNPTVAGSFVYADSTNSYSQTALGVTANTVTSGIILDSWFVDSDNPHVILKDVVRYLGEGINGTMDTVVVCITPIVGASQDVYSSLSWRELA